MKNEVTKSFLKDFNRLENTSLKLRVSTNLLVKKIEDLYEQGSQQYNVRLNQQIEALDRLSDSFYLMVNQIRADLQSGLYQEGEE